MLVATGASPAEQSDDPDADTESRAFCSSSTSPTAGMPSGEWHASASRLPAKNAHSLNSREKFLWRKRLRLGKILSGIS